MAFNEIIVSDKFGLCFKNAVNILNYPLQYKMFTV